MNLTSYGIVLVTLLVGAFAFPTNIELSKDDELQQTFAKTSDANMQENVSNATLMSGKETLKLEDSPTMKVNFPQNAERAGDSKESEMEIAPRILESPQYHDKDSIETEIKTDTLFNNTQETVKEIVETKKEKKKPLVSTQNEDLRHKNPESDTKLVGTLQKSNPKDVVASIEAINLESISKSTDSWHDFDDGKYSLLEDRLPDLTDEEFREINKEGSIPLNFLKRTDITETENKSDKAKLDELKIEHPNVEPKPETPVYITIPIVINSHSNLPISLSIGAQTVPLAAVNKMPLIVTPPPKALEYSSPTPRETNRHRHNIRSKIYARNNLHEVFAFEKDF